MNALGLLTHLCLMNLETCVAEQRLALVRLVSGVIFATTDGANFTAECLQGLGLQRVKENHLRMALLPRKYADLKGGVK
jgi:hypothetical protein